MVRKNTRGQIAGPALTAEASGVRPPLIGADVRLDMVRVDTMGNAGEHMEKPAPDAPVARLRTPGGPRRFGIGVSITAAVILMAGLAVAPTHAGQLRASQRLPTVARCWLLYYTSSGVLSDPEVHGWAAIIKPRRIGGCRPGWGLAQVRVHWKRYGYRRATGRAVVRWYSSSRYPDGAIHTVRRVAVRAGRVREIGDANGLPIPTGSIFTQLHLRHHDLPRRFRVPLRLTAEVGEGGACNLQYAPVNSTRHPCVTGLP